MIYFVLFKFIHSSNTSWTAVMWEIRSRCCRRQKVGECITSKDRLLQSCKVVGPVLKNNKLNGLCMSYYTTGPVPSSLPASHLNLTTPLINPFHRWENWGLGGFHNLSKAKQLCVLQPTFEPWCIWPQSLSCALLSVILVKMKQILTNRDLNSMGRISGEVPWKKWHLRLALKDE